jgi:eukaryotic-like serine/threonine-protein kinase
MSTRKGGVTDIYLKSSGGAGDEELLVESPVGKIPSDWSPNGGLIFINTNSQTDLQVLSLDGDGKPKPLLHADVGTRTNIRFSPDGRWVSYQSTESGQAEIYVRPFPELGGQWQISAGGGTAARWRPDGKELYYISPDRKLMAASIAVQGNTLVPGPPLALFQTDIAIGNRSQYDVAPDGRFLINVSLDRNAAASSPITLLQNWKAPVN